MYNNENAGNAHTHSYFYENVLFYKRRLSDSSLDIMLMHLSYDAFVQTNALN